MSKRKPTKAPRPRNPYWRLRRSLKERRKESAKAYRRAAERRAAREAAKREE